MAISYEERIRRYLKKYPGATRKEARGHKVSEGHLEDELKRAVANPEKYHSWWENILSNKTHISNENRDALVDKARTVASGLPDEWQVRVRERLDNGIGGWQEKGLKILSTGELKTLGLMTASQWSAMAGYANAHKDDPLWSVFFYHN